PAQHAQRSPLLQLASSAGPPMRYGEWQPGVLPRRRRFQLRRPIPAGMLLLEVEASQRGWDVVPGGAVDPRRRPLLLLRLRTGRFGVTPMRISVPATVRPGVIEFEQATAACRFQSHVRVSRRPDEV